MFPRGNKIAKGGKRPGAGRPTTYDRDQIAKARRRAETRFARAIERVVDTYELVAIKGLKRQRFDKEGNVIEEWTEYDTATLRDIMDRIWPKLNKLEVAGKDGRPLVPVTIVAPDPNGPIPSVTDDRNEKPAKEDMH